MDPNGASSLCPAFVFLDSPSEDELETDEASFSSRFSRSSASSAGLLCEFADEVARGSDSVEALIARHAGKVLPLPWPEGAGVLVDPDAEDGRGSWRARPGARNRILDHCCCDILVYVVGRGAGLPEGFDLIVLMDVFGRYYAHRGGSDDALYLLSTSAEDFVSVGYRFLYPLHCRAPLSDVGIVLGRLSFLVRQGADAEAVARFVVRGHGENVGVARRMSGVREVLRLCSLGCLRWSRRDGHGGSSGGGRRLADAPVPEGDAAVVALGRVRRGCWPAFGTPVFVGVPTGRVFAGDVCGGSYVLVADSVHGFSGVGVSRFFENRRFGRRDLSPPPSSFPSPSASPPCPSPSAGRGDDGEEDDDREAAARRRRSGRERRPPCLADLLS